MTNTTNTILNTNKFVLIFKDLIEELKEVKSIAKDANNESHFYSLGHATSLLETRLNENGILCTESVDILLDENQFIDTLKSLIDEIKEVEEIAESKSNTSHKYGLRHARFLIETRLEECGIPRTTTVKNVMEESLNGDEVYHLVITENDTNQSQPNFTYSARCVEDFISCALSFFKDSNEYISCIEQGKYEIETLNSYGEAKGQINKDLIRITINEDSADINLKSYFY